MGSVVQEELGSVLGVLWGGGPVGQERQGATVHPAGGHGVAYGAVAKLVCEIGVCSRVE